MKIELTKDEMQTMANTLFEFVDQNNQDVTREKELKKIRELYRKLYSLLKVS